MSATPSKTSSGFTRSDMRRAFDILGAVLGLALLVPVFLVIACVIKLSDRGPVFYRQLRVGRGGRPFRIWKFRTMILDADRVGSSLTVGADPRITRPGTRLRRWKLDELPQLLNVLTGEMGFVGPRPEVPCFVELYTPEQRKVLDLRPGITDLASIAYRDENDLLTGLDDPEAHYTSVILPEKIRLNLAYAAHATLWRDVKVILATLGLLDPKRV